MRWYRLTDQQRAALQAPAEIDGFGMVVLTLFDRWEKDAIFVLVRAFVDESGVGGEGRVMLGALVARAHHWMGFHKHWRDLLKDNGIEFSHLVDMENGKPPFEGWDKARCRSFVHRADGIIQRYCDFGYTSAVFSDDHKEHYRKHLPTQAKDSAYGTCARTLIEEITLFAVAAWGKRAVVNFIFEDNQHFDGARVIFRDLKNHVPDISSNLGQIAPGDKKEFGGLQGADIMALLSRRAEPRAIFSDVDDRRAAGTRRKDGRIRIFHANITPQTLQGHVKQAHEIATEKRVGRRQRGFERWKDKKGYS